MQYEPENELEKTFIKVFNENHGEIQAKISAAAKLIDEAESLSEQYGIPFKPKSSLMWCRPSYLPKSLKEKFPGIDMEFVMDSTGAYGDEGYSGWQMSQV